MALNDKLDYLLTAFDYHLSTGMEPVKAWQTAVQDYAIVYHGEGGTPLNRAAALALHYMGVEDATG